VVVVEDLEEASAEDVEDPAKDRVVDSVEEEEDPVVDSVEDEVDEEETVVEAIKTKKKQIGTPFSIESQQPSISCRKLAFLF